MMVGWRKVVGLSLLSGGLSAGLSPELPAATSATRDTLSIDEASDTSEIVGIGHVAPIAQANRQTGGPLSSGNPLWSVPLSTLVATRDRPIFSASRRAPQRAVAASSSEQVAAPPPSTVMDRPPLALVGAIVGDRDSIAVFLDLNSQKIVRLRLGEAHSGWVLSSVLGREVTLKKADHIETLGFQRQEISAK
jgi:general secretion pathway protein N